MECHCKLERLQQSPNIVALHDIGGIFSGKVNDYPVRFVLHVAGHSLYGKAEGAGMVFILMGRLQGNLASGRMIQHQLGSMLQFHARLDADRITLWLEVKSLLAHQQLPLPFGLQGQGLDRLQERALASQDNELIGMWARQEVGKEVSVFMEIRADGSYRQGHARTLKAGANPWAWGWDSDKVSGGKWRTQNQILYLTEGGASYWVALANFQLDDGKLCLQFSDGSQQIWYRRRRTQVLSQEQIAHRNAHRQNDTSG